MFIDALTLDAPRKTRDGYLAVRARAARTGIYRYDGAEIDPENAHGLRDAGMVNVLRDDKTVFDAAAARSFIGKPVTDDHPSSPVNAGNWRDVARGMVMGAMRDGDYLAFDLLLTDAAAIAKVDAGKRELSNGYNADLEFGDFKAADGTMCVARQTSIFGNHVALVDAGRAGSECRIKDVALCDAATVEIAGRLLDEIMNDGDPYGNVAYADPGYQPDKQKRYPIDTEEHIRAAWNYVHKKKNAGKYSSADLAKVKARIVAAWKAKIDKDGPPAATSDGRTYSDPANPHKNDLSNNGGGRMPHTLIIDGLQVTEVSDQAKAAIEKLQGQVKDAETRATASEAKVGELTAAVSAKDGEIAALNQKLKDAEINPAQLEKLVADRSALIAQAKGIDPSVVTDGKTDAEIRKAVVTAKLGDAAKGMDDAAIGGAFTAFAKDVKVDPVRNILSGGAPVVHDANDAIASYEKARDRAKRNLSDAWKGEPDKAAAA